MISKDFPSVASDQSISYRTLAASITRKASTQTYYTIRFLVDRDRVDDAYRAYAYFRWVDDTLDSESGSGHERSAFLHRQQSLLEACYRGEAPRDAGVEESMLVELIRHDAEKNSGLQAYIHNMMAVMEFDAGRRGRLISRDELANYTRWLAVAVTEAMHYFIGHNCPSPHGETRYFAVTAAHITHMLRDTIDDVKAGYFNIPSDYLETHRIAPWDVESEAYRRWVRHRVQLARAYFNRGRDTLARVPNTRCRIAGFAYAARFECVLNAMERDGYLLRPAYPERKTLSSTARMVWSALTSAFIPFRHGKLSGALTQPVRGER